MLNNWEQSPNSKNVYRLKLEKFSGDIFLSEEIKKVQTWTWNIFDNVDRKYIASGKASSLEEACNEAEKAVRNAMV